MDYRADEGKAPDTFAFSFAAVEREYDIFTGLRRSDMSRCDEIVAPSNGRNGASR